MYEIQNVIVTFKTGDTLSLTTKNASFFGFIPNQDVLELAFNERVEGRYDGTEGEQDEHHFMVTSTEYFNPKEMVVALAAFNIRLSANSPAAISGMGQRLEDFLIVNPKEIRNFHPMTSLQFTKSN